MNLAFLQYPSCVQNLDLIQIISNLDLSSDLDLKNFKDLDLEISARRNFTNYSLSFCEQIILCQSHKNCQQLLENFKYDYKGPI